MVTLDLKKRTTCTPDYTYEKRYGHQEEPTTYVSVDGTDISAGINTDNT